MALDAANVTMHAVQHELCFVVIEIFPFPSRRDMTVRTIFLRPALELTGVSVLRVVASEALGGGIGELGRHLSHCAATRFGRLVALDAFHDLMGAVDPEPGYGVLERTRFFPLPGGVAGLTGDFGLVRIGVTCVAGSESEVILARHSCRRTIPDRSQQQRCAAGEERFVALVAGDGGVPPGESELRPGVARG
jgi:hypothetical protein